MLTIGLQTEAAVLICQIIIRDWFSQ